MASRLLFGALLFSLAACQSTKEPNQLSEDLIGNWHVEKIQGNPTIDYSPAQLSFNRDGSLRGNNSCNSFEGLYLIDNLILTLQPQKHTERACIDPLKRQETGFMEAMKNIRKASLSRGKLKLTDAKGNTQLLLSRFEPKE